MSDQDEYALAMPFVACRSQGGEYDDAGLAAGYQVGYLDGILTDRRPPVYASLFYPSLRRQVDLVAMRHGYVTVELPLSEEFGDVWVHLKFTRELVRGQ